MKMFKTFCFICGLVGHSEFFCSTFSNTSEVEIVKLYGVWMRAPLRKQTKLVGLRWLHNDSTDDEGDRSTASGKLGKAQHDEQQNPYNP